MSDFTLPTNIKQIGSIGDGLRIYVEDYVCTFLHQFAEAGGYGERLAFLVGRQLVIDGQPILFINGAIHGKHVEEIDGFMRFTEKSRDYAEAMLDEHFPMMEIVGWMQSQPSYGTYLNQHYASYHLRQFRKAYQVMYVLDPIERANAFYAPDPDALTPSERMAEVTGYFIYYEKNVNMHEYMLASKVVEYTPKSPTMIERTPLTFAEEENDEGEPEDNRYEEENDEDRAYTNYSKRTRHQMEPEEIIRRHQADKARRKAPVAEQKRALNMVASLCAVLFIVSFILGVGFIRSQDRIDTLEEEIQLLTIGLRNMSAQLTPAFAEQAPSQGMDASGTGSDAGTTNANADPAVTTGTDPAAGPSDIGSGTTTEPSTTTDYTALPTPEPTDPPAQPPATGNGTTGTDTNQGQGADPDQGAATGQGAGTGQDTTVGPGTGTGDTTATPGTGQGTAQDPGTATGSDFGETGVSPETYTIQYGDSLISISLRFFGNTYMVAEIMTLNGIEDPDLIVAGRTIALPRR